MKKELRIYKTRPLARVAIMQFYAENKADINRVFAASKSQGIIMKDGTTIYFKTDMPNTKTVYNAIKFY